MQQGVFRDNQTQIFNGKYNIFMSQTADFVLAGGLLIFQNPDHKSGGV